MKIQRKSLPDTMKVQRKQTRKQKQKSIRKIESDEEESLLRNEKFDGTEKLSPELPNLRRSSRRQKYVHSKPCYENEYVDDNDIKTANKSDEQTVISENEFELIRRKSNGNLTEMLATSYTGENYKEQLMEHENSDIGIVVETGKSPQKKGLHIFLVQLIQGTT